MAGGLAKASVITLARTRPSVSPGAMMSLDAHGHELRQYRAARFPAGGEDDDPCLRPLDTVGIHRVDQGALFDGVGTRHGDLSTIRVLPLRSHHYGRLP